MFSGSSSPPKDKSDSVPHSNSIDTPSASSSLAVPADDSTVSTKKFSPPTGFFSRKVSEDQSPGGEKKRRSSTVTKAATFFSNAKQSLTLSTQREEPSNGSPSPLQKAGTMDAALSVPQGSGNNSAGESLPTPRSSFRVGVTEDKNRKCRRTMEDTHAYLYNFLNTPAPSGPAEVNGSEPSENLSLSPTSSDASNAVETDNGYFAIFDGHAGTFAAEWCGKKLHFVLQDVMRKNPNAPVPELLDQTFTSVDQQLDRLPLKNSGCTAVIALLRWEDRVPSTQSATGSALLATAAADAAKSDNDSNSGDTPTQALPKLQEKSARQRVLYTANVGDARAVLCRNGKALRLSYDHKGSDENEGKRIANAGGLVLNNRVNGVLAVTRALGDAYLKDLVTGHPYTTETVIQPEADEFVILACDGLWDVCSDQEAIELIRNIHDAQEASRVLVDHALSRFSTDNLSCMVIRFDTNRVRDVVNRSVDPIGVVGDPATSTDRGVSEADKIVEGTRKSMASAGISDNAETAEKVNEEILERMSHEEPGPELAIDDTQEAIASQAGSNNKDTVKE